MKKRMLMFIVLITLFLGGCARSCESLDRSMMLTDKNYVVRHYSGGKLIGEWEFTGIVNSSDGSDGYYWKIADGTTVEISGDVQIFYK